MRPERELRRIRTGGTAAVRPSPIRDARVLVSGLVLALLAGWPATAPAAEEALSARQIVAIAAKRQGGGELARKGAIRDFKVVLDVQKHETGQGRGAGKLVREYRPPSGDRDRPLFRESWTDSQGTTERGLGYKGDLYRGWTKQGRRVTVLGPKHRETYLKLRQDADDMGNLLRFFLLENLLGDGVKLTRLPDVKMGDRVEWRVKREVEGARPLVLGIDRETKDLTRVIQPATDGEPVERIFTFARPKELGGIRVPDEIRIRERDPEDRKAGKPGRETTVAFVDDLEFNRKLPDSHFDVPG